MTKNETIYFGSRRTMQRLFQQNIDACLKYLRCEDVNELPAMNIRDPFRLDCLLTCDKLFRNSLTFYE